MSRLTHFISFALLAVLGAVYTATGGFVLKTSPVPVHVMPAWLWNLTFTSMMLVGIILFTYSVLRCCDEAFLKPTDRRRITGQRQYKITRKSA